MATSTSVSFDSLTKDERAIVVSALEMQAASWRRKPASGGDDQELLDLRAKRAVACDVLAAKFR